VKEKILVIVISFGDCHLKLFELKCPIFLPKVRQKNYYHSVIINFLNSPTSADQNICMGIIRQNPHFHEKALVNNTTFHYLA